MEEELKCLLTGYPCPPIKGSSLPLGKNRGKSVTRLVIHNRLHVGGVHASVWQFTVSMVAVGGTQIP